MPLTKRGSTHGGKRIQGNVKFSLGREFLILMGWLGDNVQQANGKWIWNPGEIRSGEIDLDVTDKIDS